MAVFMRRKSGVYHEDVYQEDFEPQRRRRLSKPFTNSSSANPTSLATQQLIRRKSLSNKATQDSPITLSPNESREALHTHLFVSTSNIELSSPRPKRSTVAMMASKFEGNSTPASASQLSLASPGLLQRPMHHMLSTTWLQDNHKPSISSLGSKDRYGDLDMNGVSPASSSDQVTSDPAPPARRTASFIPGIATRAPEVSQEVIDEETESSMGQAESVNIQQMVKRKPLVNTEGGLTTPLLPADRSGTPSDLEYAHIGRLGLGSLHVVNGTTSPAPSEMSRQGKSFQLRRDTSSVYPESEMGTIKYRKPVANDRGDTSLSSVVGADESDVKPDISRAFSFKPGSEARFNHPDRLPALPEAFVDQEKNNEVADTTTMMAADYMAGLPTSPFATSSPPFSPKTLDSGAEIPSSPLRATPNDPIHSSPAYLCTDCTTPRSESSVRRYEDNANNRRSFLDEALGCSPLMEPPETPTPNLTAAWERADSPASFFSVPEPDVEEDEMFRSAVELQPVRSRSRSPRKSFQKSPLKEAHQARDLIFERTIANTKSDSGYSSNTSLSTLQPAIDLRNSVDEEPLANKDEKRGLRFPFRKTAQKSGKPVLVKPTPSTKVPSPTSARIESASALTSTTSLGPTTAATSHDLELSSAAVLDNIKDKQRKRLQKIRRKSTVEAAGELVIQRVTSVESFHVPLLTATARTNLARRSEAVPELERTYKTQYHTRESATASVLSLAPIVQDVRFPSPPPEEEEHRSRRSSSRTRSHSRKRSVSRPRSWFGWSKQEKDEPTKKAASTDQGWNNLSDLGSIVDLLGDNPYDMAQANPKAKGPHSAWDNRPDLSRRRTSPSNITSNGPRQKAMMDDQAASNVSKLRRSSYTDKEVHAAPRQPFDDRAGVPGKFPHTAQLVNDAPPLPPMPSSDEINRRIAYRHGFATHPSPLSYQNCIQSEPIHVESPKEEAPPPPPHSPRPSYIDDNEPHEQQEYFEEEAPLPPRHSPVPPFVDGHNVYEHAIHEDVAPPPPCHSPRPMDLTSNEQRPREVSWSSQANAWSARRQSAGAALRNSWSGVEEHYHPAQTRPHMLNEPIYAPAPEPELVHGALYQQRPNHQWRSEVCHDREDVGYTRKQQRSAYSQAQGYFPPQHSDYYEQQPSYNDFTYSHPVRAHSTYYDNTHWPSSHEDYYHQPQARQDDWRPYSQNNTSHHAQLKQNWHQQYDDQNTYVLQNRSRTYDDSFNQYPVRQHSRPASRRSSTSRHSRPTSRHSNISHRSHKSLAEDLHPEYYDSSPQPNNFAQAHSPQIGRYSGGLEYNYDKYSQGFDGSAGTRSASTAKGNGIRNDGKKRSSWLDMEAYGVDLGDVPIMGVPVGVTGSRMIYH